MLAWIQAVLPVATALGLTGLVGLELRSASFREGGVGRERARTRRNWAFFGAAFFTMVALRFIGEALRAEIPALLPLPSDPLVNALACFFVAELLGWLSHWVKHRHGWLWRFHVQHHREDHYDLWLITHTHALEVLVTGVATTTILLLLGFSPLSMQIYFSIYTVAKAYQHSSHALSLGPLDRFLVGPAYHRQHHEIGAAVNFGIVSTTFDLLFGTARWSSPEVSPSYGAPGEPFGFVEEMAYFARPEAPPEPQLAPAACATSGP